MSMKKILLGSVFLLGLATVQASAAPIPWTFENAALTDGRTFTGGYKYDASTNTLSDINVILSAGLGGQPASKTFTVKWVFGNSAGEVSVLDQLPSASGYTRLYLYLGAAMTEIGGRIQINDYYSYVVNCHNLDCTDNTRFLFEPNRSVLGTAPVPAALPLLATGLGAFGFIGWRRKQIGKRATV